MPTRRSAFEPPPFYLFLSEQVIARVEPRNATRRGTWLDPQPRRMCGGAKSRTPTARSLCLSRRPRRAAHVRCGCGPPRARATAARLWRPGRHPACLVASPRPGPGQAGVCAAHARAFSVLCALPSTGLSTVAPSVYRMRLCLACCMLLGRLATVVYVVRDLTTPFSQLLRLPAYDDE